MEKFQKFLAVMLLSILQLSVGQVSATAQSSAGVYSVTVNTAGTFGQVMLQNMENWSDVVELTVSGHLNSNDMAYFSRMLNLTKLDVSNTDITSIGGCERLSQLESVVLPSTVTTIEDNAFYYCSALSTINQGTTNAEAKTISCPNVKSIGDEAFSECKNIQSISFPIVEEIGDGAFYNNTNLSSAEISNVKHIGDSAFGYCESLKSIDIHNCEELGSDNYYYYEGCFNYCTNLTDVVLYDKLTEIPHNCFSHTAIQQIDLPSGLTSIGYDAFYGSKLTNINIPEGVKTIESDAFNGCPLASITLPSTLASIGSSAFYYSVRKYNSSTGGYEYTYVLSDVYCNSVTPIVTTAFNSDMVTSATLHVPAFSVSAYKLDDNWYKFNKIEALDGDLTDVTINNTFTIIDYTGLSNNANLTLTSSGSQNIAGHLSISGENALTLNNYIQDQNFKYTRGYYYDSDYNYTYYYTYPYCTTLITNNEVSANTVTTRIQLPTNQWSFISFPYDVNVSSIVSPEGTMWVVRKYNGSNRAAMTGDTWENVTSGQTLNAGEGYIFHCVNEDSNSWSTEYVEFEFPAVNNSNKNKVFAYDDIVKTINEYPAEFSHNRGWNLIGNPYPSFFSSQYVDFPAPITVWNGSGYTAYSLADDEYIIRPNEAFFVQCPVNTNQVTFMKDGRTHDYKSTSDSYYSPARTQASSGRSILNFTITDDNYSDRARLVLNESASCDYEIECDASKFMSSDETVPQIYIIDNGISYAINERPLGIGEFTLGVKIGNAGSHRISLDAKNSDYNVVLVDNETNKTTDLVSGSYTFESGVQTYNNRFTVKVSANQSSVEDITSDSAGFTVSGNSLTVECGTEVSLYAIDGKLIFNGVVDGTLELPSGIYLLTINNTTHKIAIK